MTITPFLHLVHVCTGGFSELVGSRVTTSIRESDMSSTANIESLSLTLNKSFTMIRILSILFLALLVSSSYGQTEPITQPSNLNFSGIKSYRVSTSFSSSGADGHLVVISKNPISFSPTDNVEYQKGQRISDIKVGSTRHETKLEEEVEEKQKEEQVVHNVINNIKESEGSLLRSLRASTF